MYHKSNSLIRGGYSPEVCHSDTGNLCLAAAVCLSRSKVAGVAGPGFVVDG